MKAESVASMNCTDEQIIITIIIIWKLDDHHYWLYTTSSNYLHVSILVWRIHHYTQIYTPACPPLIRTYTHIFGFAASEVVIWFLNTTFLFLSLITFTETFHGACLGNVVCPSIFWLVMSSPYYRYQFYYHFWWPFFSHLFKCFHTRPVIQLNFVFYYSFYVHYFSYYFLICTLL